MIKILPADSIDEPYFELTIDYMIGDADGEYQPSIEVDTIDEYTEELIKGLNNLEPMKGHWGLCLRPEAVLENLKYRRITENQAKIILFELESYEDAYYDDNEIMQLYNRRGPAIGAYYLRDSYCDDREVLVFRGITVNYIDKFGRRHDVEVS